MAGPGVRLLARRDGRGANDLLELSNGRLGVGVSWQAAGGRHIDIDLQCVVVDQKGSIVDCAYYNNLKAAGRGVTHSGDETVGRPNGIQECVWVSFSKLPETVSLLVFVVAAYAGGSLGDATDGRLHVFEDNDHTEIACFQMERSSGAVDIVAAVFKDLAGGKPAWGLKIVDKPAERGQHFMDILPLLGELIREYIPQAPSRQKVAFAMAKGGILDLPQNMGRITVGLGWDIDAGEVDLDVSAVLLDSVGRDLEAVFFGRLESVEHGVRHSGDNLTGQGDGDDEQIYVSLDTVGPAVSQIIFVVNIYSKGRTFRQVARPYCRIVDMASGSELCKYSLSDAGDQNGLMIARIAREVGGRWGFHALGLPCQGRTWKDSMPALQAASSLKTASLMVHTTTGFASEAHPSQPGRPPPGGAAPTTPSSKACVLL